MKRFFKGIIKHIGRLDAEELRKQYELVANEFANSEMLLNALKEGIVRLDAEGRVVQSNPAARHLLGMAIEDALPMLGTALGKSTKREIAVTYPESRILEIQTIPLGDETIVFLRDITAEKARSEEELRAGATAAVRDLASGVAHEIGNPLNAISLSLQLLERQHPEEATIAECRAQVARLDGILRGFLTALRPSKPDLKPESAAKPLKNCLATLKHQFEEHRITLTVDIPAALPPAAIDLAQIEQVYFNLLKNSLEAMADGGAIEIAVRYDDEHVIVSFRDHGAGMTTEQLTHLFEPYRTSKAHGTGLGLMISKRIVTDHGGSIEVESAPGEGSVFTIRLPRLERRIRELGDVHNATTASFPQ